LEARPQEAQTLVCLKTARRCCEKQTSEQKTRASCPGSSTGIESWGGEGWKHQSQGLELATLLRLPVTAEQATGRLFGPPLAHSGVSDLDLSSGGGEVAVRVLGQGEALERLLGLEVGAVARVPGLLLLSDSVSSVSSSLSFCFFVSVLSFTPTPALSISSSSSFSSSISSSTIIFADLTRSTGSNWLFTSSQVFSLNGSPLSLFSFFSFFWLSLLSLTFSLSLLSLLSMLFTSSASIFWERRNSFFFSIIQGLSLTHSLPSYILLFKAQNWLKGESS